MTIRGALRSFIGTYRRYAECHMEVARGGVYWHCTVCRSDGAVKAGSQIAIATREEYGIAAPAPCSVQFNDLQCPHCREASRQNVVSRRRTMITTIATPMTPNKDHQSNIPVELLGELIFYAHDRVDPSGFLRAILENDLRRACERAYGQNRYIIWDIVSYIYNEMPSECWGNAARVRAWLSPDECKHNVTGDDGSGPTCIDCGSRL